MAAQGDERSMVKARSKFALEEQTIQIVRRTAIGHSRDQLNDRAKSIDGQVAG